MTDAIDLESILQPGMSFSLFINDDNPNNTRIHIRAIVDHKQVVWRAWSPEKQRWMYQIESRLQFEMWSNAAWIRDVHKDKIEPDQKERSL